MGIVDQIRPAFRAMAKSKIALKPKHPERVCRGGEKLCSADDLRSGNGTIRTQHPAELFGEDRLDWELDPQAGDEPERSDD
jgi:hypothetical protein